MKTIQVASSLLALGLTLAVPNLAIAHVGHGDEFQAEGGNLHSAGCHHQ